MADNVKLLRGTTTVLACYPEAFANPAAPTSAELNDQFVYSTNEDAMVFNISCSLTDDGYTYNLSDSETDDTRTICEVGQLEGPLQSDACGHPHVEGRPRDHRGR